MIFLLLYSLWVLIVVVIAHELGHFYTAKYYYKVKYAQLKLFKVTWPEGALSKKQKLWVYLNGVLFGELVLIILTIKTNAFIFLPLAIFYNFGCMGDIKKVWGLLNE